MSRKAIQAWLDEVEEDFLDTHGEPPPPIPARNPLRLAKTQDTASASSNDKSSGEQKKPQESTEAPTDHSKPKAEHPDKRPSPVKKT
ncbi:hypothetical protein PG993_004680 [Apiospora rasikravindrae]|uniref:Uncharacterized protein n=1 Tax=Apiospora rasikravindrae TaxID=990691 RepID=A0ABR1TDF7_9PEZI